MATKFHTWAVLAALIGTAGVAEAQDVSLSSGGSDQIWAGTQPNSSAGVWLDTGAVSAGDNRRDLIIGAPGSATVAGVVYVIFGGPTRTGHLSLANADAIIAGAAAGDLFGAATAAGNIVNTEGTIPRNLAVGAPGALSGRGIVYLFDAGFVNNARLDTTAARLQVIGAPGDQLGAALATGDLDGDGYRELIIGAPGNNRIYVIAGSSSLSGTIDLSTTAPSMLITGTSIGRVLAAGDINGDGHTELLIGSPVQNTVYVLASGPVNATRSLPSAAIAAFTGNPGDRLGSSIKIGDFDGTPTGGVYYNDIALGAPGNGSGKIYLLWGSASVANRSMTTADVVMLGPPGYVIGDAMTNGDVNRDQPSDVVAVARSLDGTTHAKLLLYYGRSRNQYGTAQSNGSRLVDFGAGQADLVFVNDSCLCPIASAAVFEVTGEGARDVIAGVPTDNGATGNVYFTLSPRMSINFSNVTLTLPEGQVSTSATVQVSNPSIIPITFATTLTAPWLSTSINAGTAVSGAPGQFTVTTTSEGLTQGTYTAAANVVSTSIHLDMTLPITVSLTVTEARYMAIDTPTAGATLSQPFTVTGWAVDTGVATGTGVDRLDIYGYPDPGSGKPPLLLGTATYGLPRPSVGTTYGARFTNSGFTFTSTGVVPGLYQIVAKPHSPVTGAFWTKPAGAVTATVLRVPSKDDFNRDGITDIIWHHSLAGWLGAWQMNGSVEVAPVAMSPNQIDPSWRIVAFKDFNGDGHPDLLFENDVTGNLGVWFMNGTTRTGLAALTPNQIDPNWKIVATADFDGDGKPDLLWRHTDGWLGLWLMDGTVKRTAVAITPNWVSPDWKVIAAADINGDGKPDIIWRHKDGWIGIWVMDGTNYVGPLPINPNFIAPSWDLVAVADFNGDGKPDMLWRSKIDGSMGIWYLDGTTRIGIVPLTPRQIDPVWRLAGPK